MVPLLGEEIWKQGMCAHRGKTTGGHSKKAAVCKPRGEAAEEINPADNLLLILDFSLQNREKINFCCSSPPSVVLGYGSSSRELILQ